jgi:site-specific recombinase XerD
MTSTHLATIPTGVLDLATATGDQLAGAWLATKRTDSTRAAYRADLARFVEWCADHGTEPLAATIEVVNLYRIDLESQELAPATIARRLSSLSSFFGFLVRRGVLTRTPVVWEDVPRPKVSDESPTLGLDESEAVRFLNAAASRGPRDEALVCLLLLNGLRVSEALAIDLDAITTEAGHRTVRVIGKGAKVRTVPLSPRTIHAIERATDGRTTGPVLTNHKGERLGRRGAARIVNAITATAGLIDSDGTPKRISPHSCRHTFVTLSLAAGQPLHRVQDDAGHASPVTTQRYNRQRDRLDNASTYVLSALLGGS